MAMKKSLLTFTLAAIHLAAFSQAQLVFNNDANHLVVIDPVAASLKGVPALGGLPAPQVGTPTT